MLTPQAELEIASAVAWMRFCEIFPKLQLSDLPRIQFNNRLRTTAARIFTEERVIEVASKLYKGNEEEYARVLIPHELAHMVDMDLNGETDIVSEYHRESWQKIMVAFGLPPNEFHELQC